MNAARRFGAVILLAAFAAALWPALLTRAPYDRQFREFPNAPASRTFPLGTDELGRDRFARLLYGARVSLLAAPAAALISILVAAAAGGAAGFFGGRIDRAATLAIDLMLSLPWLFLLIMVRALLPLNVAPAVSIVVTFGLIGLLGWAPAARIIRAACRNLDRSDLVLQARACGVKDSRVLMRYVLPNVRPILIAQFWASIPLYILAEANLALLGLGIADPLPSWGNLLRPLESPFTAGAAAWTPLACMVLVVSCFYLTQPREVVR